MRTSYKLKQLQYSKIYQASERTVRNWMKKGAPLDNPREMVETFLQSQRTTVAGQKLAELPDVQASYQREANPVADAEDVRAEFSEQISRVDEGLMLARNFVRKYEPEHWQQIVERLNGVMKDLEGILEVAGIGEDYEWKEPTRADLAKPVIWDWTEDRQANTGGKS